MGRRDVRDDTTGTGASDRSALGVRGDDTDLFGNPTFDESDSLVDENDTGVDSEFDLAKREQQKINEQKAKQKVEQREKEQAAKREDSTERTGKAKQLLPGYIYPTDPKTLETGKPYPESDVQFAPRATPERPQADVVEGEVISPQDADVNVQGDIIPAIPTVEVLDGLGIPKASGPYQLAKNELVANLEANDREAVSETMDKIFDGLKKYGAAKASGKDKTTNAVTRARVAEYAAKASPKELPEAARQRRAETAIARSRIKDDTALAARLQDPVSGEVQDIRAENIANKASNIRRSIQEKKEKLEQKKERRTKQT